MSNVLVNKDKLDVLANAISNKSGEALTLTLDEMVSAVDGIETGGGGITPTGNIDITQAGVTDVTNYATATVPPLTDDDYVGSITKSYYTVSGQRKWIVGGLVNVIHTGLVEEYQPLFISEESYNAVPTGTSVTPTESSQTIGGANTMLEGAVTVNAIPSNYVGSGITQRQSSDLSASGATVTAPSGYYASSASKSVASGSIGVLNTSITKDTTNNKFNILVNYPNSTAGYIDSVTRITNGTTVMLSLEDKTVTPSSSQQTVTPTGNGYYLNSVTVDAMPSGTEGTPTATKGTVSNHAVTVTPSVTNSAGYISGGTHNGSAVTVSASELVSGSQTVTENDTYDVTNLATLVVNVSGGSSTVAVGTKTTTLSASASSISFTGLSGNPTSFVVTSSADQSTGGTKAVAVAYDGTNLFGMDVTTQAENDTGFTKSYSSGTLTITATSATFEANEYKLVYTYGGSSSDIHTADVQVGSGATSITFSSLSGRPLYFSCVFKSTFSTSSGYQRVMDVVNDGSNTYGHAFDSSAKAQTSWTYSYSGGSLTITSSGTNNGGYFHQPGYYQLTYAVDDSAPTYQTKSAYATTSAQTITADNGYDALEQVNLGALSQTNLTAGNIKSGTTITINNGSANVWSVTGTYSGGGGGSFSVATTTWNNSTNTTTSHEFTGLSGTPKFAVLRCTSQLTRSSSNTYYYIADIVWNGTDAYGNYHLRSNGSFNNVASNATTKFTVTTGTNSITFTSGGTRGGAPGSFYNGTYELTYIY